VKRQAENLDIEMKRCKKNIQKTINNIAGHSFDSILQNILRYLRLLIYEVASFINFQAFFLYSPANLLRRFSTPNRFSNLKTKNLYFHQCWIEVPRDLSVPRAYQELRDSSR
jgi:hypothetical protein